jgi:hypothetical protein
MPRFKPLDLDRIGGGAMFLIPSFDQGNVDRST